MFSLPAAPVAVSRRTLDLFTVTCVDQTSFGLFLQVATRDKYLILLTRSYVVVARDTTYDAIYTDWTILNRHVQIADNQEDKVRLLPASAARLGVERGAARRKPVMTWPWAGQPWPCRRHRGRTGDVGHSYATVTVGRVSERPIARIA